MQALTLPSPVKLNLFLHVTGRRTDGYHQLQTLFVFLEHGDTLELAYNRTGTIRRVDAHSYPLPDHDICIQAATRLRDRFGSADLGVDITLRKRIPPGTGLGAGSSNAATVLHGLNRLWDLGISNRRLYNLGRELGADVPVFINGYSAWAEGVGDELKSMPVESSWYVVILPPVSVPTVEIFTDSGLPRDTPAIDPEDYRYSETRNDLEQVTRTRYPPVAQALDLLSEVAAERSPAARARMSGSGAAVFVDCDSRANANEVLDQTLSRLKATPGFGGFVAKSANLSPLFAHISR